ncbi:polysaccharide pyruvyl transferase family protein [Segatella bryantii]|uniref:Polysaccharide pyruvyl transferase domain-containing protein n=1 Tax=Segatella bryantii TaxID=77095 RepID=A0ABX4EL10_SEGBR|nr:polysaccharide pyruvyl transferase family protein [Segatella bryantii]OYP57129.1 hypothetical protein CIK91_00820 [Segatella bryantii]UKK82238.1 polysaccharide pyruvyl transferase family protein [Segatella bryantii]
MKIKTITCHNVYNYGASLQAYALQHYLESLGNEVEIIDFMPWFLKRRYNLWVANCGKFGKLCKIFPPVRLFAPIRNRLRYKTWGRKAKFDAFTQSYLHLTTRYNTSIELQNNPPQANLYIAGSDQIWNTELPNGKEPAYFLDFGTAKKISYAASFGINEIDKEDQPFVKHELGNFDYITVREKTGLEILKFFGFNDAVQVVDPVFLLNAKQWMYLGSKAIDYKLPKNKYILVYDFFGDERIAEFSAKIKAETGYEIVSLNDYSPRTYVDYNINDAGPLEFISLIENAGIVVSSSFHGSVFSLIFHKQFYVYSLKGSGSSSRMADLMYSLGISEHYNASELQADIDYCIVDRKLLNMITNSKIFLQNCIKK